MDDLSQYEYLNIDDPYDSEYYNTCHAWIDDLTPCLKDSQTGEYVETYVKYFEDLGELEPYTEENGWYINWAEWDIDNIEVYGLFVEGNDEIQGLVGVNNDTKMGFLHLQWLVSAPDNRKKGTNSRYYIGIGGHLFAIAAQRSFDYGYDGSFVLFASNTKLVEHYMETFGAEFVGLLHVFHMRVSSQTANELINKYTLTFVEKDE